MNYEPPYGNTYLRSSISSRVFHQIVSFRTLGARDFSCTVSGFGLKKWPARKASGPERHPFDSAEPITTPLIPKHPSPLASSAFGRTRVGCTKLPVAREKKPLVPRVRFLRRDRHISRIDLHGNTTNELTEPQRPQNREKKSNMLNKQNKNSERTCRTLFSRFLCLHHTRLTLSNLTGKAIRSSL